MSYLRLRDPYWYERFWEWASIRVRHPLLWWRWRPYVAKMPDLHFWFYVRVYEEGRLEEYERACDEMIKKGEAR